MSICYYELADNRYLGMSVFEISSFPGSISTNTNFDTYNSLTPNWYYKVLR